jgi:hypothetical protein
MKWAKAPLVRNCDSAVGITHPDDFQFADISSTPLIGCGQAASVHAIPFAVSSRPASG